MIKKLQTYFILTDLDNEQCITNTKRRIDPQGIHIVVVSVKTIESWFLADTEIMRNYFNDATYYSNMPESVENPFETIKATRLAKTGKGFSDKKILANTMVHKLNFSILRAAQHPNCKSAKYFLNKIAAIAAVN